MNQNKRFWVEHERILNTYVLRIFKDEEIIFEINNWNSLNESNKVECEGIANELNKLSDENEVLKSTNVEYEDALGRLEEENEKLRKELRVYRKVASCSNCNYHNYDWFDDGDEFEVCDKGNDVTEGICEEWREL